MKMVWKPHKNCSCPTKTTFHAQKLLEYRFKVKITFKKIKFPNQNFLGRPLFMGSVGLVETKHLFHPALYALPLGNLITPQWLKKSCPYFLKSCCM